MGKNIYGSIEVRGTYQPQMGHLWVRVVDLEFIYSRVPMIYIELFDAYSEPESHALFANRGLPGDVTIETAVLYNKIARHQASGMVNHATWFTWDEMKASDWLERWATYLDTAEWFGQPERNWDALFDIVGTIAKNYGAENVRFVVWFDNG